MDLSLDSSVFISMIVPFKPIYFSELIDGPYKTQYSILH